MARSRCTRVRITSSAKYGVWRISSRNRRSSTETISQSVLAMMVALRGEWSISAISPKISPSAMWSISSPSACTETAPLRRMNIRVAGSPACTMGWPAATFWTLPPMRSTMPKSILRSSVVLMLVPRIVPLGGPANARRRTHAASTAARPRLGIPPPSR